MANILISTIWSDDSVRYCIHKLGIDEVVLVVDKHRDEQTNRQREAVQKIHGFAGDLCLLSWGKVPGTDNGRIKSYLRDHLRLDWADSAQIEKTDDSKTIRISFTTNWVEIRLSEERREANLVTSDGRTYSLGVKEENNELKIYGDIVKVRTIETELYDIPKITEDCVRVIDDYSFNATVYVNITPSRKTQSLGLLFAAYKRINTIESILYYMEDQVGVIDLPKLQFELTDSQKELLNVLYELEGQYDNLTKLAEKTAISRAMLYKNIDSLEKMGFITKDDTYKLTKAGLIARL